MILLNNYRKGIKDAYLTSVIIQKKTASMKDIEDLEDIKIFVNGFYNKVQTDELLAPVFAKRIENNDWGRHLSRMYDFWNTVLFFQRAYKGNPFPKHVGLGATPKHFARWTFLFKETIDSHFEGTVAEETKNRVDKMAALFMSKLEYMDKNPGFKPLF